MVGVTLAAILLALAVWFVLRRRNAEKSATNRTIEVAPFLTIQEDDNDALPLSFEETGDIESTRRGRGNAGEALLRPASTYASRSTLVQSDDDFSARITKELVIVEQTRVFLSSSGENTKIT